ncbi:antibiotic biosynthesis monooxygenase family protein [Mycobacterium xenopi 4042]|uniref:Antibiotic biosynthesis monooxygenase family protein n=1 Tax=Mycobacterium xenopi 4042 TaxID=1299334 RepID=X7ZKK3_MYCXE|nr:antibiotic biosynthesis monooxygenase family protein [Mycobacterium xenopi 4042]
MYARSTTIEAQPSLIDTGIAHVRDVVMPRLVEIDGCVGMSLLVDRESGRCIATSAWQTREAMHASAEQVRPVRDRAAQAFGGSPTVDEWEIAVLHRDHRSGRRVRAGDLAQGAPDQFDRAIAFYRESVLPDIEKLEGFCSASLMLDRTSWRAVASSTFDSMEAMQRNRDQARSIRTNGLRDLGADQLDVGEFELAIAQLRVPELV